MTNYVSGGETITAAPTHPTAPAAGAPCRVGLIPGVATGARHSDGRYVIARRGIYNLSVKGENNAGNVAVAIGDALYYEDAATPTLNKDNVAGAVLFGYALGAVSSGATATIPVEVR